MLEGAFDSRVSDEDEPPLAESLEDDELEPPEGDVLLDPLGALELAPLEVSGLLELPGLVMASEEGDPGAPGVMPELDEPDEEEPGEDGDMGKLPEDPLLEDEPGGDEELPVPALPELGPRSPHAARAVATAAAVHSIAKLRGFNSMLSLLREIRN